MYSQERLCTEVTDSSEYNLNKSYFNLSKCRNLTEPNLKTEKSFSRINKIYRNKPISSKEINDAHNLYLKAKSKSTNKFLLSNRSCTEFDRNNIFGNRNLSNSNRFIKKFINLKEDLFKNQNDINPNYFNFSNKINKIRGFVTQTETNDTTIQRKFEDCNRILFGNKIEQNRNLRYENRKNIPLYKYSSSNYKRILPNSFYNRCSSPSQKYLVSDLHKIKGNFIIENNKLSHRSLFRKEKLNPMELFKRNEQQEFINFCEWK